MPEIAIPTSIDLFCGAGGLTLGLGAAGFTTSLGSDFWEPAIRTFRRNFQETAFLAADARELTARDLLSNAGLEEPPDLVAGGPPCQGFSSAGARVTSDERNNLVSVFARLVAELRPRAVLFENVEGFLTAAAGNYLIALLDPLIEAGYRIHLRKCNVANYGVPQLRKRVIGFGLLGADPLFPAPTHRAEGAPGVHRVGARTLQRAPSVREALAHLPPPTERPPGKPSDHFTRPMSKDDRDRVQALLQGQTMRDLPPELHHPSYRRRAYRRVMDGTPTERRGGAPAALRRLREDEPAKAITGAGPRELVHPTDDRQLTLRECARLQTFPDSFEFLGNQSERALLIGNAVPPLFGAALGAAMIRAIELSGPAANGRGSLLSFEPTVGDAKSPALQAVERRITRRYSDKEMTLWP
jgi:DNA (cytosine-5)-methyltransferase 1